MDGYETLYYTTGYSIFYSRSQPQPSRGKRSRSQNKGQTWDSFPGIPIIAGSTRLYDIYSQMTFIPVTFFPVTYIPNVNYTQ